MQAATEVISCASRGVFAFAVCSAILLTPRRYFLPTFAEATDQIREQQVSDSRERPLFPRTISGSGAALSVDRGGTDQTVLSSIRNLHDVLLRISTHRADRIDELLPDRWKPADPAWLLKGVPFWSDAYTATALVEILAARRAGVCPVAAVRVVADER